MAAEKPFFMYVTPTAPHVDNSGKGWQPPPPAARHENLYANDKWIQIPKGANYARVNPNIPSGGKFVTSQYDWEMEDLYIKRLRSLRAVDEMITAVGERARARCGGGGGRSALAVVAGTPWPRKQHACMHMSSGRVEERGHLHGHGRAAGLYTTKQRRLCRALCMQPSATHAQQRCRHCRLPWACAAQMHGHGAAGACGVSRGGLTPGLRRAARWPAARTQ